MDILTKEKRSWNMSRIKGKNTKPEVRVRSLLHRLGYRFRIHRKDLPGKPDIVLPKYRAVIFVNGCYWHRHADCKQGSYFPKNPSQGIKFWREKFKKNIERDSRNVSLLKEAGWNVIVIWECEASDLESIATILKSLREE